MGGERGTEHIAECGGLGTRQGAHRRDGGGGTVLMYGPLVVNRTLLTGPEERSIGYMVLNPDCFSSISLKFMNCSHREKSLIMILLKPHDTEIFFMINVYLFLNALINKLVIKCPRVCWVEGSTQRKQKTQYAD